MRSFVFLWQQSPTMKIQLRRFFFFRCLEVTWIKLVLHEFAYHFVTLACSFVDILRSLCFTSSLEKFYLMHIAGSFLLTAQSAYCLGRMANIQVVYMLFNILMLIQPSYVRVFLCLSSSLQQSWCFKASLNM